LEGFTHSGDLVGAKFDGLTSSYMTDKERAALDPNSREHFNRVWGSKIQVIGWSFYAFILWALKVCVTTFYGRLTYVFPAGFGSNTPRRAWGPLADFDIARHRSGLTHLKTRVRAAYMLLAITYLAVAFTILLSCQPMHKFWQINPDPSTLCKPTNSPAYVLVVVIPNVLTDAYLLYIPLPVSYVQPSTCEKPSYTWLTLPRHLASMGCKY
jgi:hypothetical protein